MVVDVGQKIHIITRRLFDGDLRRHFAGVVEKVSEPLIVVRGFAFVFDESRNTFVRRDEERLRVFSVAEAGLIINILPTRVEISKLQYGKNFQGQRVLSDGASFSLNINEFNVQG